MVANYSIFMNIDLIQQVIADTEYHVTHSADPEVHRARDFVETILKPHIANIQSLLSPDIFPMFEAEIRSLRSRNEMAAISLTMLIREIRTKGIGGCLKVCLGEEEPSS